MQRCELHVCWPCGQHPSELPDIPQKLPNKPKFLQMGVVFQLTLWLTTLVALTRRGFACAFTSKDELLTAMEAIRWYGKHDTFIGVEEQDVYVW